MSHPLLVPETYGRVQFPRLVRQQSTRLEFVIAAYDGLLKELRVQIYSTGFYHLGLVLDYLIVPPQCTGRMDTRLPRSQEVIPFLSSPSYIHRLSIQPFVPTGANMVTH
jgi:hypothetical protein